LPFCLIAEANHKELRLIVVVLEAYFAIQLKAAKAGKRLRLKIKKGAV
jgi:hypothetical protein